MDDATPLNTPAKALVRSITGSVVAVFAASSAFASQRNPGISEPMALNSVLPPNRVLMNGVTTFDPSLSADGSAAPPSSLAVVDDASADDAADADCDALDTAGDDGSWVDTVDTGDPGPDPGSDPGFDPGFDSGGGGGGDYYGF